MTSELQSPNSDVPAQPGSFVFPVTFAQQRLWFLDQLHPGDTSYLIPWNLRIRGELNYAALSAAINEIVRRHETLRTTFSLNDGEVMQVIAESLAIPMPVTDVSGQADAREEAARISAEESRRPVDLEKGPLVRARLIRIAADEHILLLTLHHIVFDRWSRGILTKELAALYEAFRDQRPSPLPELPLQYADYAIWQREYLQGTQLDQYLSYWKQQLAGVPAELTLPTDRPRPAVLSNRGAEKAIRFSPELTKRLHDFSQQHGATLFMTLLGGFQVLLYRYSGQDDIVVGTPIFNRNRAELEGIIGFFANTLALRGDLSGEPTFAEFIGRVRNMALDAYKYQDLPFDRLIQEINPERSLSQNPLFQVLFSLGNVPRNAFELAGLDVRLEGRGEISAKFDLSMILRPQGDRLSGIIEYSTDLFDGATIERMMEQFERMLEAAVANPGLRVSELPLLSAEERAHLVFEVNATAREYPRTECLHDLISRQAARSPERIAVVSGPHSLTYAELEARANRLAHGLIRRGAGPDTLVGIRMSRGVDMLAGLLGILKAGAGYVPLDPSFPADRIAWILEDSGARIVLSDDTFSESGWQEFANLPPEPPATQVTPERLAYVLHTSGSTGRPKGVEITHRNLVNFLWSMRAEPGFTADDTLLAVTTISFDIAGLELYLPLLTGGRIVLASREESSDAAHLNRLLERNQITVLQATPATWRMLIQAGWKGNSRLKALCGGEAMAPELAAQLLPRCSELWNMYGPTETTVWSSVYRVQSVPSGTAPLGKPIANTTMYILDRRLSPVPAGVSGELFIGGDGVARGYLNRPDLTADRFLSDPFVPGGRIYKTGDVVKLLPSGDFQYLGRADFQVKVRGFRIELGEVETVLARHSGVRECVAAVADERLIGYVIPISDSVSAADLRVWMKERLPEYMVPSVFVELKAFPLTPNGKVDRRALPAPEATLDPEQEYAAPATPAEEKIAGIFAELLKLNRVGAGGHFFELGGHSLLATQVVSRIREAFGAELPLRSLFEAPTVSGLASLVARLETGADTVPLRRVEGSGPYPLSFGQQRLWFLDQLNPLDSSYNMPYVRRLRGALNIPALEESIGRIVRRHQPLRTRFDWVSGDIVQIVDDWQPPSLRVVEAAGESEARAIATEEARRPFDLRQGPLFRATLIRIAHEDHVLLLNTHHIASDGWSLSVMARELSACYAALCAGVEAPLEALPIRYGDYAAWERQYLSGSRLQGEIDWWVEQLRGAPRAIDLPTDRPRPATVSSGGARFSTALPPEITEKLRALSRQEGATLFMTLLASFSAFLCRYSRQEEVVVGTPIAGRNRRETENLIGLFLNTLPLRVNVGGNPTFRELVARARETAMSAYAHQELPFEKLVQAVESERDTSRHPLFQVMLVLQNLPPLDPPLNDVAVSGFATSAITSKFDLMLVVTETPERLRLTFEYNTDLFDAATIERMAGNFGTLLAGATETPEREVTGLPLLGAQELGLVLGDIHAAPPSFPQEHCIHELFEAQAERTPDRVAVVFGNQSLSYAELNRRANRVAHALRERGIGPESLVAIWMERALEMPVAILGVLKSGAGYLPLDPVYPSERLAFMLSDANVPVLLTQEHLRSQLPEFRGTTLSVDAPEFESGADAPNPRSGARPGNVAYVIYTSGSTGKPKGCIVTHANVARLFSATDHWFHFTAEDTWTMFHSFAFDFSVWEIWGALLYGGKLVVVPSLIAKSPEQFHELLVDQKVTVLNQTPSAFRHLIAADERSPRSGDIALRYVIFGGEALEFRTLIPWIERHGDRPALINMYGITETTVHVTYFRVPTETVGENSVSIIGEPIPDLRVYVLDPKRNPSPIGVTGEMYVGGDGVARGYLNRPELTAERFIPDLITGRSGDRLYKTGDLARMLPDGKIQYLGRIDHQVKIRGFRVELGEIEAGLLEHPAIRECIVIDREDVPGDQRLAAYLVARGDEKPGDRELRNLLLTHLPEYMAPSAFVWMAALPLTPNGKVDRRALPAPEYAESDNYVAPRTALEARMASIWAEVLRLPRVGIHDDFFELGGYSLLAVDLFARIEREIGQKVPLGLLFDARTIAAITVQMDQHEWLSADSSVKPLRTAGSKPPIYAAYGIGATVLTFRNLSRHLDPEQPIYCLEALGIDSGWNSLEELAATYVRDMLAFQPHGPYHLIGASFGGMVVFEIARQLRARGMEVGLVGLLDSYNMGDRNVQPRRERLDKHMGFVTRRLRTHMKRLVTRRPSQWPRYLVGRMLAVGRLIEGVAWRVVYRTYKAPTAKKPSMLRNLIRVYELAGMDYIPREYPGEVVLFRSERKASKEQIARLMRRQHGWIGLAKGGLEIIDVPGDHHTMLQEPNVGVLVAEITACLDRYAQSGSVIGETRHPEDSAMVLERRDA